MFLKNQRNKIEGQNTKRIGGGTLGCMLWGKTKKLTWLQAYVLGDVGVIWCNSLGDSLFQILCDEFCRLCS